MLCTLKGHGVYSLPIRHRGFTLIEVMVTVVVLAIGLLGLAGLQATSLAFNSTAYQRSQATNLANDIIDRMRANRREALAEAEPYTGVFLPRDCGPPDLSGDLTSQDIEAWRTALACTLPSGSGSIARNGDNFTITIQWDDSRREDDPQQFDTTTGL